MPEQEVQRAIRWCEAAIRDTRLSFTDFRSSMQTDNEEHLVQEAQLAFFLAEHEARLKCLRAGQYSILAPGQELPDQATPENHLIFRWRREDGAFVRVLCLLENAWGADLLAARDYHRATSDYYIETKISKFNSMPFAERVRRYRKHEDALRKLREGPKAELGPIDRDRWETEVAADLLFNGLRVDTNSFLAQRAD